MIVIPSFTYIHSVYKHGPNNSHWLTRCQGPHPEKSWNGQVSVESKIQVSIACTIHNCHRLVCVCRNRCVFFVYKTKRADDRSSSHQKIIKKVKKRGEKWQVTRAGYRRFNLAWMLIIDIYYDRAWYTSSLYTHTRSIEMNVYKNIPRQAPIFIYLVFFLNKKITGILKMLKCSGRCFCYAVDCVRQVGKHIPIVFCLRHFLCIVTSSPNDV